MTSSDFPSIYSAFPPIISPMPPHLTCATQSRRGRRSMVPPEQREQVRRVKKQNMERRRRACISDKMNALYNLAMAIIGLEPTDQHKSEKADILSACHHVFEGIAEIAKEQPELRARLHSLRDQVQPPVVLSNRPTPTLSYEQDEHSQSSDEFDLVIDDLGQENSVQLSRDWVATELIKPHKRWVHSDLDLSFPHSPLTTMTVCSSDASRDSGLGSTPRLRLSRWPSHATRTLGSPSVCSRIPLASKEANLVQQSVQSSDSISASSPNIWRPYI